MSYTKFSKEVTKWLKENNLPCYGTAHDSPEETKARLDAWMLGMKHMLRKWIAEKRYRELISCAHGGWYTDDVIFEPLAEHFVEKEYDVFISHLHSDHCGLISKFAKSGCKILAGETEGEMINFESGNLYWRMLDDLFIKFGFPEAQFGRNTDIHPGRKYCNTEKVNFTYVDEGDVLEYGGYHFQPILTPGHTPGHMCLYDAEKKVLFCGDHILGTITPNICIELGLSLIHI